MTGFVDPECEGRLVVMIADESSWQCTVCGWMGWPRQDVDPKTGRILKQYPHRRHNGRTGWFDIYIEARDERL